LYSFVEIPLVNSSQMNHLSNGTSSSYTQEEHEPTSFPGRPRPLLKTYQNGSAFSTMSNNNPPIPNLNSTEKDSSSNIIPTAVEKEIPKVFSTNISSSMPMNSSLPIKRGNIVSFYSSIENTILPPENIYENVPIFIQMTSNEGSFYNTPVVNGNTPPQQVKPYMYAAITGDHDSELQNQYFSQLLQPQNGIPLLMPPRSIPNTPSTTQEITQKTHQYSQQILFSDHLTNPLFNVDKQLLANTIANQFGVDLNSPYLQELIANQHLFVAEKRTFANMIWQITPEEENALCSSPITTTTTSNVIKIYTGDSNSSTAKSILKLNKPSRSVSKGQRISWVDTIE
jgi:hypothetical protein